LAGCIDFAPDAVKQIVCRVRILLHACEFVGEFLDAVQLRE
jgi:hypothetical protein